MESALNWPARVLGLSSDSATNLLCDLGQLIGFSELCLLICLTKSLGQLVTHVSAARMCS